MTTSGSFWLQDYFPALDGLRALSVAMVITAHMQTPAPRYRAGWLGVYVFFVLSGFLITTLLVREERREGRVDLRGFYLRRVFRIFPLYYAMLLAYAGLCLLPGYADKWAALVAWKWHFLFFLNEYIPDARRVVFGHSWTLGIEEKFYLVWPFCCFLLTRRLGWRVAIAAGLASLTWLTKQYFAPYHALLAGCVLALALDRGRKSKATALVARVPWPVLAVLPPGAFVAVCWDVPGAIGLFSYAMVLLVAHLVLTDSPLKRALAHAWLVKLGKLSYSMYLVHLLVVNAVGRLVATNHWPGWFAGLALNLVSSALIAEALHRLIEEPMRQRGRALVARLHRPNQAAAPAGVAC